MDTFIQIIKLIAFIAVALFIFSLYTQMLSKITQKSLRSRIANGKISDQQLIMLYNAAAKGRKHQWLTILFYGIFYKSLVQMQKETYQLYRGEMEKRGLLDQVN
ncbi:hypothetical protein HSX37_17150|uniref:Uncharacterized protein n=1 Tax=Dendrosporobacter quercicolus TaxID=146817 RepID=A0A1G9KF55_9FIRM|nr:hypothetical protein [Dendrosporobacter quercicolus]NSL49754.1 hypothetical protein [Dendrosporobacter quercicolus DSM 1736]SDL48327.1 hypothetical protein SAMN04488502_10116 [Dendrosporobacter quercicolus]